MMNPNWLGVASVILTILAFLASYRIAKKEAIKPRVLIFFLALFAAIPGISFSAYYAHILPEMSWYYQFRSISGTEFLVVFIGVASGIFATFLPRFLLIFSLLGATLSSVIPMIKPLIGPIPKDIYKDYWDHEVCMQSTPSTCGAASSATILNHYDIKETEFSLAKEAHSYAGGTEAWYLARAFRARGLTAEFDFKSEFSPEAGLPAIVGVRFGSIGHFIAILGKEGEKYIVGDPIRGREFMTNQELHQRYDFTGFHMRISKSES